MIDTRCGFKSCRMFGTEHEGDHDFSPLLEEHCDFCHAANPAHKFPHLAFSSDEFDFEAGEWAACQTCTELLNTGDWDGLVERAMQGNPSTVDEDPAYYRGVIRRAYAKLREVIGLEEVK